MRDESRWRLRSNTEHDEQTGNSLYWSNEFGWANIEEAEIYSTSEREIAFSIKTVEDTMNAKWEKM